ncbi:type I-C CRISPR-associated protein Cas8c/Csd1 [Dehalococcoides mccartyi]|uniref:type I-C CRISPR-associated protein Cas8c/Csd1 n=1 Tax=Dehalococcoides mccartyi TaxID=61435 RepID=UPI0009959C94|nr:type I-C CRISPR-associated protein Cas8c/Csd1 [Dehalococcoides mccartyi]AQW61977.1 type I-C CRISPR-associated protein Cas8c/Csd1 [Dehalococcoides mccartyi]
MSWMYDLYQTYQNCISIVGKESGKIPLNPVGHVTVKQAHIEVRLDGNGNFKGAEVITNPNKARTIIPATEKSAGRTCGPEAHPLCDKLQYSARDYKESCGEKPPHFDKYIEQLADWATSEYAHSKVKAVYQYQKNANLISDLIRHKILIPDKYGKMLEKWEGDKKDKPLIFRATKQQAESFVRWRVEIEGDPCPELHLDKAVWENWQQYLQSKEPVKGFCCVSGKETSLATQHPRKIRSDGDGAKLISSNDTANFTFRGRFTQAEQACSIGFDVTQKAHSALRWLIGLQGKNYDNLSVVAWAISGNNIPNPTQNTYELFPQTEQEAQASTPYTAQEVSSSLIKLIGGYKAKLAPTENIAMLMLDSATTGRISIKFYQRLTSADFLEKLYAWHNPDIGCSWHQYFSKTQKFLGAPSAANIASIVYPGSNKGDNNMRANAISCILPSIIQGRPLPRDIIQSCIRQTIRLGGIKSKQKDTKDIKTPNNWFLFEKALGIACALYRYQNKNRRYQVSLERDRTSRDYLYGRLLAVAEALEQSTLDNNSENRSTNAERLFQKFAERPFYTWSILEPLLNPYKMRLRNKNPNYLIFYQKKLDEIACKFLPEDFTSDKKLSGEFLLGYHCQRADIYREKVLKEEAPEEDSLEDHTETHKN